MEWRGVTTANVFVANFFFAAAFGLVVTAQWELSVGNGFAYTVFSAFGLFYAGYGAILTPAFGVQAAYGDNMKEYNNALGFFMISQLFQITEEKGARIPLSLGVLLCRGRWTSSCVHLSQEGRWCILLLGWTDWVVPDVRSLAERLYCRVTTWRHFEVLCEEQKGAVSDKRHPTSYGYQRAPRRRAVCRTL
ncbi:hypothetical protein IG631_09574 [Alternaria alternata]|nr:hypothetical protein IG631_09574 [Alternaria alternata]